MTQLASLRLSATNEKLADAQNFACQQAGAMELPETLNYKLELVLEELFINVVNHAYPQGSGHVEIVCSYDKAPKTGPERFGILLRDWGIAFNPLEQDQPSLDDDLEQRPIGGLGIFFVTEMADTCSYNRYDEANEFQAYFNID